MLYLFILIYTIMKPFFKCGELWFHMTKENISRLTKFNHHRYVCMACGCVGGI